MRTATVTLAVSLAGCLSFGHCEMMPDQAVWSDPALYTAMDGPVRLNDWAQDAPMLSLHAPELRQRWGVWNLTQASWSPRGHEGGHAPLAASADLGIHAIYQDGAALQAARSDVESFLAGFLRPSGPDADDLLRRLLANATQASHGRALADGSVAWFTDFRADLPAGWTPQPAWDGVPDAAKSAAPDGYVGGAGIRNGNWTFGFVIGVKQVAGEDWVLHVDGDGDAVLDGMAMGSGKEPAYRKRVVQELEARGLPAPDPAALTINGSVC